MNKLIKISFFIILFVCTSCRKESNFISKTIDIQEDKPKETVKKIKVFDLSKLHEGNRQSPINLEKKIAKPSNHNISIHIDKNLNALNIKHHTLELELNHDSYIEANNKHYDFKQLHFHTPSEHNINSIQSDMEMHIVSVYKTKKMKNPQYLVMGILFRIGKENKFISNLLKNIPRVKHHSYEIPSTLYSPLNLDDLFNTSFENYVNEFYYYNGSLTTYPYTETVDWYVLNEMIEASEEQIKAMKIQMGNNARELQ